MNIAISPLPLHGQRLDAVLKAYFRVFGAASPTPEARTGTLETFLRHGTYPGWRGLVALEPDGGVEGEVLGFAYGYTSTPGQFYRGKLEAALGPELSAHWLADSFEFVELGVVPWVRRRGIARRLHDALLLGLPHRTAVLTTWQSNTPARRLYESLGWQVIHDAFQPSPEGEPYVIMGLDLPAHPRGLSR